MRYYKIALNSLYGDARNGMPIIPYVYRGTGKDILTTSLYGAPRKHVCKKCNHESRSAHHKKKCRDQ